MRTRIFVLLLLCVAVAGCGGSDNSSNDSGTDQTNNSTDVKTNDATDDQTIEVTFADWKDIQQRSADDKVKVTVIDLWSVS